MSSHHIRRALELIESVKGSKLDIQRRCDLTIELAAEILQEGNRIRTRKEKKLQEQLARMMNDPQGKVFTTKMTDQCFRSNKTARIADEMVHLMKKYGIPRYFSWEKRAELFLFKLFGKPFHSLLVPLVRAALRKETASVILPGEAHLLSHHMQKRKKEGLRLNINHLGEAILGEGEVKRRIDAYLTDLANPEIDCVSIKISTIYSQITLLAWHKSVDKVSVKLRELYRTAMKHQYQRLDGTRAPKFVYLDMEEFRDLILTKEIFKKVLSEEEFLHYYAGIALQAYLPDSFEILKELTQWSRERVSRGGAPIRVRIVKGANLAMEQIEASYKGWSQAPYTSKLDVDANYKKMVNFACAKENAEVVRIGIASHNLFDIAYGMILRAENGVEDKITFEMLEGMADHIRRVVQTISQDMLLYCPVAYKEDFQSAVAYLIRRLDENTGEENFLRDTFDLTPNSPAWERQVKRFQDACNQIESVYIGSRRKQTRFVQAMRTELKDPFKNESDTDFALPRNREWLFQVVDFWHHLHFDPFPNVIAGKDYHQEEPSGVGFDPSNPKNPIYRYTEAPLHKVEEAMNFAKHQEKNWSERSPEERANMLLNAAQKLREHRGNLIGAMLLDGGKSPIEADPEISEAIDFAEYYARSLMELHSHEELRWKAKGTILITPPWNFPVAIPCGGILAALVTGNCLIFKPAPEAVLTGYYLVKALWESGIPKEVLQFISCDDDEGGSSLIRDVRVNAIILTGGTQTARLFMQMRPSLDLSAETGGKNALIITSLADRDLAIKELLHSAFGHSGQKCSAASLAVLEAEVYDDPHFLQQLKDAATSMAVGSAWDVSSKLIPLIREPGKDLYRGLTKLDEGESWLVEPKQDPNNPNLWSMGIKLGVKKGSYSHQTEFFGPLLCLMRASNLEEAIAIANGTPYGLTSGIHTLDEREIATWISSIEAGNLYVNRGITGAIVQRQPFGGCKESSFGHGSKAGGPNYLSQFMLPLQHHLPKQRKEISKELQAFSDLVCNYLEKEEEKTLWEASLQNYAYAHDSFRQDQDPSQLIGQDNFLRYVPLKGICLRVQNEEKFVDVMRVIAACLICGTQLIVSHEQNNVHSMKFHHLLKKQVFFCEEGDQRFCERVAKGEFSKVRILSAPSDALLASAAKSLTFVNRASVLATGRIELLNYLREVAISIDYHRYGNLGDRESPKPSHF